MLIQLLLVSSGHLQSLYILRKYHGSVQNCNNSSALAMYLLQSSTSQSVCRIYRIIHTINHLAISISRNTTNIFLCIIQNFNTLTVNVWHASVSTQLYSTVFSITHYTLKPSARCNSSTKCLLLSYWSILPCVFIPLLCFWSLTLIIDPVQF